MMVLIGIIIIVIIGIVIIIIIIESNNLNSSSGLQQTFGAGTLKRMLALNVFVSNAQISAFKLTPRHSATGASLRRQRADELVQRIGVFIRSS